jgi:predicted phage terminase large subunit-like protein
MVEGDQIHGEGVNVAARLENLAEPVSQLSDYSVCATCGVKHRRVYLLQVLRRRMEFPELKRTVFEQARAWRATVVLIEDKASGTQLIQELLAEGLSAVTSYMPEHHKIMRLYAQTAAIENGFVNRAFTNIIRSALPADRAEDFWSISLTTPPAVETVRWSAISECPAPSRSGLVAMLQTSPESCRLPVLKPVPTVRIHFPPPASP